MSKGSLFVGFGIMFISATLFIIGVPPWSLGFWLIVVGSFCMALVGYLDGQGCYD